MVSEGLNVDIANRSKRDPAVCLESVYEALALNLGVKLLLNGDKRCWVYAVKLMTALVRNPVGINRLVLLWSIDCV